MPRPPKLALVCSELIKASGHGRAMWEVARRLAPQAEVHALCDLFDAATGVKHERVPVAEGFNLWRVFAFHQRASRARRAGAYDLVHAVGGCVDQADVVTCQFGQRAWGRELAADRAAGHAPPGAKAWARGLYHEAYWRLCDRLEAPAFAPRPGKRLVAVSQGVREELIRDYGADPAAIRVIPNGVDVAEFSPQALAPLRAEARARWGLPEGVPVALFVGDFRRKGLGPTIAALAATGHPEARLLVAGRGEEGAYRSQALALGLGDRLAFAGFLADVRPAFAAADAFVFPTRYEPFGMVIAEAMAAGLPVLTTRRAGAAEWIAPGEEGLLVEDPADVGALAAALGPLLREGTLRARLGQAARAKAQALDWSGIAKAYAALYAEVLAEKGAPPLRG